MNSDLGPSNFWCLENELGEMAKNMEEEEEEDMSLGVRVFSLFFSFGKEWEKGILGLDRWGVLIKYKG